MQIMGFVYQDIVQMGFIIGTLILLFILLVRLVLRVTTVITYLQYFLFLISHDDAIGNILVKW